ncbi:lachesin [Calliphora vicina]|uniref:lachesin n=1 Tax=Calliphora vicina TaxID=7373 RepID=UPI00325C1AF8
MLLEYMTMLFIFGLTTHIERTRYLVQALKMPTNDTMHDFNHNIILDSYDNTHPEFDNSTERDVIAAVGTTARLHCRVKNLGDRAVSWIRKRDLHILTIGIMTYTNDQRFLARHIDNSDEWVLKIVSVQPRDAGVYECQVSVEPKISQAYKLMVVTSKAQILANRELFVQSGSDINLTCIAPQAPGPYTHMLWFKDSELINDSTRGGIRVVSEQQMKTSNLVISRVTHTDSGNYTCAADNSNSDSVFVHIINSEKHAAMQHELASRLHIPRSLLVILTFFYTHCSDIMWKLCVNPLKAKVYSSKVAKRSNFKEKLNYKNVPKISINNFVQHMNFLGMILNSV